MIGNKPKVTMMMSKCQKNSIVIVLALLTLLPYSGTFAGGVESSGFLNLPEAKPQLPQNTPSKVIVLPWMGDIRLVNYCRELFSDGLFDLGFGMIASETLGIPDELCSYPPDIRGMLTDKGTMKARGIQGVFIGEVHGQDRVLHSTADVKVSFVDLANGEVIWKGSATDNRRFGKADNVRESAEYTVSELLKRLAKDLEKSVDEVGYAEIASSEGIELTPSVVPQAEETAAGETGESAETADQQAAEPVGENPDENIDRQPEETVGDEAEPPLDEQTPGEGEDITPEEVTDTPAESGQTENAGE